MLSGLMACSREDSTGEGTEPRTFSGQTRKEFVLGGSGEDTPRQVVATADGGFALVGFSNSTDGDLEGKKLPVNDYWLVKMDPDGRVEWSRTIGGSGDDRAQALVQTRDGGFAIAGYAMSDDGDGSLNMGFHDNWVVRLDSSGEMIWERSFGFSGHDHAYDIIETRDGGLVFAGFLDVTSSGGAGEDGREPGDDALSAHGVGEFWVTRLDADGGLVWRRYFGGTNNDRAYSVIEAENGDYLVAGATESEDFDVSDSRGSYDFWVLRLDRSGELLWERSFGGSGIDRAYAICPTKDGNYLVAGNTFSVDGDVGINHGGADIWVLKIDKMGELLWEKTYGGSEFETLESLIPDGAGGYLLAGSSRSSDGDLGDNQGENDIWLIRIGPQGEILWEQTYGGSGEDFGFSVARNQEGATMLVGEIASAEMLVLGERGDTAVYVQVME